MNNPLTLAVALKRLGLFALLGFAVIVLAGPIVGILSALLSIAAVLAAFGIVGYAVWTIYQTALKGPEAAFAELRAVREEGRNLINRNGGSLKSLVTKPLHAVWGLVGGLVLICAFLLKSAWTSFWFVTEVAIVAVVGVMVGGAFGWGMAHPPDIQASAVSHAALGGVLAAIVGVILSLRERLANRTPRTAAGL
jgi:hypothetical protein